LVGGYTLHYPPSKVRAAALSTRLSALAADTARKLDVLGHDGDALGVDSAEVGVLEEANQVRLAGFLERQDSQGLEAQVCSKACPRSGGVARSYSGTGLGRDRGGGGSGGLDAPVLKSWAISRTRRWNGSLRMSSSVLRGNIGREVLETSADQSCAPPPAPYRPPPAPCPVRANCPPSIPPARL
jgi:hypothetical protein